MSNIKNSSQFVLDSSKKYSLYVCEHRAIPKVTDGLKDGQRKALWVMRKHNKEIKTISLAGEMISSNIYLHGDASASDTISRLAGPFLNNEPYLEGIGSFGTRIAPIDGIGAPRYTYVKKNKILEKIMYQDLEVVPTKENYDGSTIEPETFLPIIPTILLNGVSGIAVGWSTEILPRNINDIVKATKSAIKNRNFYDVKPSYDYLNNTIYNIENNTWEFNGDVTIIDKSTVQVNDLPVDLSLERFKQRLDTLEDQNKINYYTDNSAENIDIRIKFKRGTISDWTNNDVIKFLKLKTRKTERIVVINWDGKSIKQYNNSKELIKDFVEWRLNYYYQRFRKMLSDDSYELNFYKAVKACFDNDLPKNLPKAENKDDVENMVSKITKDIEIDKDQANKIVSMPSFRWAKDYYETVKEKIKELEDNIKHYNDILNDKEKVKDVYLNELDELSKSLKK